MIIPLEITYRGLEKSEALENHIRGKAEKLERYHERIISCRVVVEEDQEEQRAGSLFRVRVIVRVPPGREIIGTYESLQLETRSQLETAVSEAFDAARRQLLKVKAKQQGETKHHPMQEERVGHVMTLFRDKEYGFIRTQEGREMYFHKNAVLNNDFDRLEIGTGVRYSPSEGEKGPQASTVQIVDKPGVRAPKTEIHST